MSKYLFIVPSLSKGGAERVVSILANGLISQNREATIITHFQTPNSYYVDPKVKIICLSKLYEEEYRKKINVLYLFKLLIKLRHSIISESPDHILPFLWTTCIRTHLALLFTKYSKRTYQTIRNNPKIYPGNKYLNRYRNYLVKKSKITLVQNKQQQDYFEGFKNIFVLPNPITNDILNIKRKTNKKQIKIIGVGRLEEQKNFSLLIDAVSELKSKYNHINLVIYGEGSLYKELKEQINKNNMNKCIELYGRCNSPEEMYSNADIYVLSSNYEGMPNTLLESMAIGIACISTNCETGPSEMIINKKNGYLIPINNKEALKEKLISLIENPKLRETFGQNARKHIVENYRVDKITKKLISICEGEIK